MRCQLEACSAVQICRGRRADSTGQYRLVQAGGVGGAQECRQAELGSAALHKVGSGGLCRFRGRACGVSWGGLCMFAGRQAGRQTVLAGSQPPAPVAVSLQRALFQEIAGHAPCLLILQDVDGRVPLRVTSWPARQASLTGRLNSVHAVQQTCMQTVHAGRQASRNCTGRQAGRQTRMRQIGKHSRGLASSCQANMLGEQPGKQVSAGFLYLPLFGRKRASALRNSTRQSS